MWAIWSFKIPEKGLQMSSNLAIKVQNLSKRYQIYEKPQDRFKQMLFGHKKNYFKEFTALNNVSFDVKKGQTIGIIGRNGSGKSTLLQIICETLNPTFGQVKTYGKVAALLELGSGFNPEFTGKENVYMSAAIYGLSDEEIAQRYEKIVAFADIGEHIDQPVKTYSSGMYVRLAFSVIAHVDADILIIDEALSVGDAVFAQKCMRFIRKFKENGTLLFVSHDMSSVINLCESAIWLNKGEIQMLGSAKEVAEEYLEYTLQEVYCDDTKLKRIRNKKLGEQTGENQKNKFIYDYQVNAHVTSNLSESNGWTTGGGEITSVELTNASSPNQSVLKGGESLHLEIKAKLNQNFDSPILGFIVKDRLGQDLFGENTLPFTSKLVDCPKYKKGQEIKAVFGFKLPMLPNGQYVMMVSLADGDLHHNVQHHYLHDAIVLNVNSSKIRWGLVGIEFNKVELGLI